MFWAIIDQVFPAFGETKQALYKQFRNDVILVALDVALHCVKTVEELHPQQIFCT